MSDGTPTPSTSKRWNPSPRTQLILASILAGAVAIAVVAVMVFHALGGSKPTASDDGGGEPAIVASPTPQTQRDVIDSLGGDEHAGDDDGGQLDVGAEQAFAIKAVKAYVQWDSNESPEARQQRLEPYFPESSTILTGKPDTANEDALSHKGARTVTSPVGDGYASPTSVTDSEVTMKVTLRYDSTATYDGYAFNYDDAGEWEITVPRHAPAGSKVISMSEPPLDF